MRPARDRPSRRLALAGLLAAAASSPARALSPADITWRFIVPFPPGGPTDVLARLIADSLKSDLPAKVVVENKPGGSGTIGVRASLAATDGYTLVVGNNQTHATAPFLIKDAGYDPLADSIPVAGLAELPHVLVVRPGLGISDVKGLIERAGSEPGKLNFGSTGAGSGSHLALELLLRRTGTRMQHVPYQGAAQMIAEIAAGRLDLAAAILPAALPLIEASQVTAIAVASSMRAPQPPAVPTLAEAGVTDAEAESWIALFAPVRGAGTQLDGHVLRALYKPEVGAQAARLGLALRPRLGTDFRMIQAREIRRWRDLIQQIGLKPE